MDKVLITGGAQGIGLAFVNELKEKSDVVVVDQQEKPKDYPENVQYIQYLLDSSLKTKKNITWLNDQYDYAIFSHGTDNQKDALESNLLSLWALEDKLKFNQIQSILFVLSISAHNGMENRVYASSKGAGLAYMKYLANVYSNTRINSISPGAIMTPMNQRILGNDSKKKEVALQNIMQRWGRPDEVAKIGVDLLKASFVTGQDLIIDGGELSKHHEVKI